MTDMTRRGEQGQGEGCSKYGIAIDKHDWTGRKGKEGRKGGLDG